MSDHGNAAASAAPACSPSLRCDFCHKCSPDVRRISDGADSGESDYWCVPVIDRLQERLEAGFAISRRGGEWHLLMPSGNGFVSGITLKKMLFDLIFMEDL